MNLRSELRTTKPQLTTVAGAIRRATAGGKGRSGRADIVFVNDAAMVRLAGRYRNSPKPTDVLAFQYDRDPWLLGEIAISLETAKRQAQERRVPLTDELILLCVHGLLHIQGHGDESIGEWRRMRVMEFETLMRILK